MNGNMNNISHDSARDWVAAENPNPHHQAATSRRVLAGSPDLAVDLREVAVLQGIINHYYRMFGGSVDGAVLG